MRLNIYPILFVLLLLNLISCNNDDSLTLSNDVTIFIDAEEGVSRAFENDVFRLLDLRYPQITTTREREDTDVTLTITQDDYSLTNDVVWKSICPFLVKRSFPIRTLDLNYSSFLTVNNINREITLSILESESVVEDDDKTNVLCLKDPITIGSALIDYSEEEHLEAYLLLIYRTVAEVFR